jgi:two-component system nitrate/nitrite response regulator NarP
VIIWRLKPSNAEHMGATLISVGVIDANSIYCAGLRTLIAHGGFTCTFTSHDVATGWVNLQHEVPNLLIVSDALVSDLESKLPRSPAPAWSLIVTVRGIGSDYLGHEGWLRPDGLILRDSSESCYQSCLDTVVAGRAWLDRGLYQSSSKTTEVDLHCLSRRELEIARLAAQGLSNKEIGRALKVSNGTVKIHLHHVFAKLRISNRKDLAESIPLSAHVW